MDHGESLPAPLLDSALQNLDPDRRIFVIDLGGLRQSTLEVLGAFRCRLDVIDLELRDFDTPPDVEASSFQSSVAAFENGLPALHDERADLLLCWTYLNYFSIEQLRALMQVLIGRLKSAAQIHALIESSATSMPATPRSLAVAAGGAVFWPQDLSSPEQIPTPRHSTDRLLGCLPGFSIERTMLLANGQKEVLFSGA